MAAVIVNVHESGLATTVMAAIGLVLALASLAWQAYSFALSGSRIRVDIRQGFRGPLGVMIAPGGPISISQAHAAQGQGYDEAVFAVVVTNAGRSPTTLTAIKVAYGNGAMYTETDPTLPLRLDAESETTRYFGAVVVTGAARVMGQAAPERAFEIRGSVLVSGRNKPVISKNKITLPIE